METCENCGRTIGKLETPHIHGEHVVCAECAGRLSATAAAPAPPAPALTPEMIRKAHAQALNDRDNAAFNVLGALILALILIVVVAGVGWIIVDHFWPSQDTLWSREVQARQAHSQQHINP